MLTQVKCCGMNVYLFMFENRLRYSRDRGRTSLLYDKGSRALIRERFCLCFPTYTTHTHTHTSLPLPIKATIATFGIFSAFISFVFHNVYGVVLIFRKFKMKMLGLEIAAPPIAIVQLRLRRAAGFCAFLTFSCVLRWCSRGGRIPSANEPLSLSSALLFSWEAVLFRVAEWINPRQIKAIS